MHTPSSSDPAGSGGGSPAAEAMTILAYNRQAWDELVARKNRWTVPVTPAVIQAARAGDWSIVLTPTKPVPRAWFPPLQALRVLCLAGGGGQQGPVLAAAGARVTVFDNSPRQLAQDRAVAQRDGLELETVAGDMADLGQFAAGTFDLVVHPCANSFVPHVCPVWREAHRVLRAGGILMAGSTNPARFIFNEALARQGELKVRHALPYSDQTHLTEAERAGLVAAREPFVFSHSLTDLLGGQIDAGFVLTALYEDKSEDDVISKYLPGFLATRAIKPAQSAALDSRQNPPTGSESLREPRD